MLIDAGPLVSLCDRGQPAHQRCRAVADASLVILAEILNERTIFTLDSDFLVYRLSNGGSFRILPE